MLFSGTSGKTIKDSGVQISALQPKDATLTALAGIASTNGLIEQTGVDVFSIRGIGISPTSSIPTTALADARYAPISVTAVLPATATPLIESGTGAVGTATKYAREDHVHPLAGGSGNVIGPASAVDSNFAAFDTTTGKLIKDSGSAASSFATPGSVTTAISSAAVRYDVAQGLTAIQMAQGRSNIAVAGIAKIISFTASGTYTPSAGLIYCIIECVGGGGGGGGTTGGSSIANVARGGSGGGYSRKVATSAQIGASLKALRLAEAAHLQQVGNKR